MEACPGLVETILISQGSAQGTAHSQSQAKAPQGGINGNDQKQGEEDAYAAGNEKSCGIHKRGRIKRLHVGR